MSYRVQRRYLLYTIGLLCFHAMALTVRFSRDPSTLKNGFMYDHISVQHALVLGNKARVGGLPLTPEQRWTRLMPTDMPGESGFEILDAGWRNRPEAEAVYRNQLPLGYVLNSIASLIFGVGFWTLRLGPLIPFGLILLCFADIGRRLHSLRAGMISAVVVGLFPCVWQSMVLSKVGLGNMALVSLTIWLCVVSERLKRWWLIPFIAILTAMSTRGGEYVSDGLLCLAAILPVLAILLLSVVSRVVKSRKFTPVLGAFALILAVYYAVDWEWLFHHGSNYVVAESGLEQNEFNLRQWFWNLQSYLWLFQYSLFLPAGSVLLLLGTAFGFKWWARPMIFALLSSIVIGLIALSIPNKIQDYYLLPFVPALAILMGVGFSEAGKWGLRIAILGGSTLLVSYGHGMFFPDKTGLGSSFLDPGLNPSRPVTTAQSWFADWRWQDHTRQGNLRQKLAKWLQSDQSGWIADLPEGAVIVIPWNHGNQTYDGMATLMMAYRPDLLVLNFDLNRSEVAAGDILRNGTTSRWLIVPEDAHRGMEKSILEWGGSRLFAYSENESPELLVMKLESGVQ